MLRFFEEKNIYIFIVSDSGRSYSIFSFFVVLTMDCKNNGRTGCGFIYSVQHKLIKCLLEPAP